MASSEVRSYQDLIVWQRAMTIAEGCYLMTRSFPKDELYGMVAQIRRSAASVPANIAEGYGRDNTGNFVQFLRIAQGSLKELETHLHLANRVGLVSQIDVTPLLCDCDELGKMLRSYLRSIESSRRD